MPQNGVIPFPMTLENCSLNNVDNDQLLTLYS